MNFWKDRNIRWNAESIREWDSVRKTAYILLPLLIYYLIHDMAEVVLWFLLELFATGAGDGINVFLSQNGYTVRGILGGLAILAGLFSIRKGIKEEIFFREKEEAEGWSLERKVSGYCFLAGFAFLAAFGLNLLFDLVGLTGSSASFSQTVKAQYGVDFVCGLILYGILSPIAEEAVFRGLIYNRMGRCFNWKIALFVSALIFGAYHGNVVQGVYGTILGILIAYTYERYKSFMAPVLFHAVANLSIYVITYHNALGQMEKEIKIAATGISLIGAALLLIYIIRYTKSDVIKQNSENS